MKELFEVQKQYLIDLIKRLGLRYDLTKINKVYEEFISQNDNPEIINFSTRLGEFKIPVNIINIEEEVDYTIVFLGGAAGPSEASSPYALPIATKDKIKVIMLPHLQNEKVDFPDGQRFNQIRKRIKTLEKAEGIYTPQGEFIAEAVKKLNSMDVINGKLVFVGFSNGGPIILRAVEYLSKHSTEIASRISKIITINSAGFFDTKEQLFPIKLINMIRAALGYSIDTFLSRAKKTITGISNLRIPSKYKRWFFNPLNEVLRDCTVSREKELLINHTHRIVSSASIDAIKSIPKNISINIVWGGLDLVFPAKRMINFVSKNIGLDRLNQYIIDSCNHNSFKFQPHIYSDLIERIIKKKD
jgi:hypothetical protein